MRNNAILNCDAICGGADGPRLLIMAGVHGDEFEPIVAVKRLRRLLRRQELRGEAVVIPVANHSAWRRKQRTGDDGLDLARTFPGRAQGSVTEQAAFAVAEQIRRADYLIDMHTGGAKLRIWPLAGYVLHPRADVLEKQRTMARAFNLPAVWGTDPQLQGRSLSVARDVPIPAIYVEYLGGDRFCRPAVHALVEGCLRVMALLSMIEHPATDDGVRFWAEDGRPGAGHLQISHQAPHEGRFESAVELGERVDAGDTVGWLLGSQASQRSRIAAEQAGRVVCLHGNSPVAPGAGLVVVVDFTEPVP